MGALDSRTEFRPASQAPEARLASDIASRFLRAEKVESGGNKDARPEVERTLVDVESFVMVRLDDAALFTSRTDEEESTRHTLLIRGEVLASHGRLCLDKDIVSQCVHHGSPQQFAGAFVIYNRTISVLVLKRIGGAMCGSDSRKYPL